VAKTLKSLGLDLGTTTTQMVVSELTVEDRAVGFTVPKLEIGEKKVLYQSPIHLTPLLCGELVDGAALSRLLEREYAAAGITPEELDTGAVIVTGETSRKENARTVLEALAKQAGKFVVATAGPDLESVLAARGAGASEYAGATGKTVVHLDIGGGTANLALCQGDSVRAAGCLNVGGRLVRFDTAGRVLWVSPALRGTVDWKPGDTVTEEMAMGLARTLAKALGEALGLLPETDCSRRLRTPGAVVMPIPEAVVSFSGGVADCIESEIPWLAYGDLGPLLGRAIRESPLCRGEYRLGSHTIRATVIGAGCHTAALSGSTVSWKHVAFPLQNLPVVPVSPEEQDREDLGRIARQRLESQDTWGILALPGWEAPDYSRICRLADRLAEAFRDKPCRIVLERDMAKALGTALSLRLPEKGEMLVLDGLLIPPNSYLDALSPVGPAVTVVVKTLAFEGS